MLEAMKATISNILEAVEEIPPHSSHQHSGRFSWMGFLLNKRRLPLSGEDMSMQLFLKDNIELLSFDGTVIFANKC